MRLARQVGRQLLELLRIHRPPLALELQVYCEVFRYRFEGQALSSKEAVKHTRRIGKLRYVPRIHDPRPGRSLMIAMLLADDQESYVIPLLNRACMLEVRGGSSGEWELSFTMLMINADTHPLFMHMHRPDLKRSVDKQDKRMVVILPPAQYEPWLDASPQEAFEFMREYPAELLTMTPEPLPPKAKEPPQAPAQPSFL